MLNARGTALSAFEISYRRADRAEFDPLVAQMEDSLSNYPRACQLRERLNPLGYGSW